MIVNSSKVRKVLIILFLVLGLLLPFLFNACANNIEFNQNTYMEANNLDVVTVRELMSDEVGYLEKDATNPKTGKNDWSVNDKKQYIVRNSNAQEQADFAVDEVEIY